MTTQTQAKNLADTSGGSSSADTIVGFAVLGCMAAGGVGVFKALSMGSGADVLLCLLGSVVAFGTVFYVYFGKR